LPSIVVVAPGEPGVPVSCWAWLAVATARITVDKSEALKVFMDIASRIAKPLVYPPRVAR
jgi:hypothetical protein